MNPNPNPMSGMALAPLLQSDFEVPLALLVGASAVGDGSCHTRQVPVGAWVPHVLSKRDLKRCGPTPKTRATPRALARPTAAHLRANRWYNFVVDKL